MRDLNASISKNSLVAALGERRPVAPSRESLRPTMRTPLFCSARSIRRTKVKEHRDKSISEVVALGQKIRSETLGLIAGLTDEQLQQKIPGARWFDGSIGGILSINADHGRNHFKQASEALGSQK